MPALPNRPDHDLDARAAPCHANSYLFGILIKFTPKPPFPTKHWERASGIVEAGAERSESRRGSGQPLQHDLGGDQDGVRAGHERAVQDVVAIGAHDDEARRAAHLGVR